MSVLLAAGVIALGITARAQVPSPYQTGAPNFASWESANSFPLTLAANTTTNFPANGTNTLDKTIRQDHGMSVFATVISTNAAATTITVAWDVTEDGANYTTTHPLVWVVPANFAGTNTYWTNWPPTILNNVRQTQCTYVTNNSGYTVRLQLQYSQSGNLP